MNTQIPSLTNVRKSVRDKINESYADMGKKIDEGTVNPIYPENPAIDAQAVATTTPAKTVTVDSQLLKDLLTWAKGAEASAVDNAVNKAVELGAAGLLGPEKLIDLTGSADYQQPTDMAAPGNEVPPVGTATMPGMPTASGPLSPVMASFKRRGKAVQEGILPASKIKKLGEDDVIDSDKEVIKNPAEMASGKGNLPAGGQDPVGSDLADPLNKGNSGLKEDGLEDDGVASDISSELDAEGSVDGIEGEVSVDPSGEEISIGGTEGTPETSPIITDPSMAPVEAPGAQGGLVSQITDLQSRIAELEALIKGTSAGIAPVAPMAPAVSVGDAGEIPVDGAVDSIADVVIGGDDETEGEGTEVTSDEDKTDDSVSDETDSEGTEETSDELEVTDDDDSEEK